MNEGMEIEYASLPGKYIVIAEDDEDDVSLLRSFLVDLPDAPELLVINKGDKVISFFENLPETAFLYWFFWIIIFRPSADTKS
ncbi:MAG: hypothetical protein WDM78_11720 [Puia sp.]